MEVDGSVKIGQWKGGGWLDHYFEKSLQLLVFEQSGKKEILPA